RSTAGGLAGAVRRLACGGRRRFEKQEHALRIRAGDWLRSGRSVPVPFSEELKATPASPGCSVCALRLTPLFVQTGFLLENPVMAFSSFMGRLLARTRCLSAHGRRRCRPRTARPGVEWLECRLVPSTLVVRNNFDSGTGSLRDAIATAANGDTI